MAVLAVPPVRGTTFDDAETTACAWIVDIITSRPGNDDAAGRVTVFVAALLLMIQFSVAASVKSFVLVTGFPRDKCADNVALLAVIAASALSSAKRKLSAAELRLIAGKLALAALPQIAKAAAVPALSRKNTLLPDGATIPDVERFREPPTMTLPVVISCP